MYCEQCGNQIDDDSKFCMYCGYNFLGGTFGTDNHSWTYLNGVSNTEPNNINNAFQNNTNTETTIYNARTIHREPYKKSTFGGFVFLIIMFIIELATGISLLSALPFNKMNESGANTLKTILIISIVESGILFFIMLIKAIGVYQNYICVNEIGVFGAGRSFPYFLSKPFEIKFENITYISIMSNGIRIESGGYSYAIAIDNKELVYGLISGRIDGSQKGPSPTVYPTNATWICPNCNKINSYYVGTCGCGTRKP